MVVILYHSAYRDVETKLVKNLQSYVDLTPAAIHHEYIRVDIKPLVCEPSCEYLPHACVVIRPVYGPELELSVVILLGASVFKYHHGCHGVIAAYMRYIKCFKASCG